MVNAGQSRDVASRDAAWGSFCGWMDVGDFRTTARRTSFDDAPASTHNLVVGLVEPGSRVLEFGCATGYMSQVLRDRLGASVVGVELDAEAAQLAAVHCDRILVGDAEELDLEAELGVERFDAILFADVLEHLRDPAALLRRVRPFVAESGVVVASIPNVAHASIRLALLGGSFRYRDEGLLDKGHLRFFTREGIQDLFESSGYLITQWLRRRLEVEETEIPVPSSVPEEARAWATGDPEATTYQFVVCASPADAAAQLHAWRRKLGEARTELEELRPLAAEAEVLRDELEELRGLRGAVEELSAVRHAHEKLQRRLVAERAAFADGIAAVEDTIYSSRSWRYTSSMRGAMRFLRRFKP
jgi:2-polyprenyl-3-methyl-5-hydroxy-6-metoxy-1,4-benzoquinol methylase